MKQTSFDFENKKKIGFIRLCDKTAYYVIFYAKNLIKINKNLSASRNNKNAYLCKNIRKICNEDENN